MSMLHETGARETESLRTTPAFKQASNIDRILKGVIKPNGVNFPDQLTNKSKTTLVDITLFGGFPEIIDVPILHSKINNQHGEEWTPEAGDVVLVAFINGNFWEPVVIGYLPLPNNAIEATRTEVPPAHRRYHMRCNETDIIIDKAGNRITHVSGNETLNVAGNTMDMVQGSRDTLIKKNETLLITGDRETHIAVNTPLSLAGNEIITIDGNQNKHIIHNEIRNVDIDRTVTVGGNESLTVTGTGTLIVHGNVTVHFYSNASVTIDGTADITIAKAATISALETADINITGAAHINAPTLHITADTTITGKLDVRDNITSTAGDIQANGDVYDQAGTKYMRHMRLNHNNHYHAGVGLPGYTPLPQSSGDNGGLM